MSNRRPSAPELAQARAIVENRPAESLRGWTDNYAREQLLLAEWPAEVSMPIQVFRIRDSAVAAWPGEIFASSGLYLKNHSPAKRLFNIGLANQRIGNACIPGVGGSWR